VRMHAGENGTRRDDFEIADEGPRRDQDHD
jgi:hypothetical protein